MPRLVPLLILLITLLLPARSGFCANQSTKVFTLSVTLPAMVTMPSAARQSEIGRFPGLLVQEHRVTRDARTRLVRSIVPR